MVYKINNSFYLTYGDRAQDRRHKTWCKHYSHGKCTLRGGVDCNASTLCAYYEELGNHEVKSNNITKRTSQKVRYYNNMDQGIKIYSIKSYKTGEIKDYYISDKDIDGVNATPLPEDCQIAKKVINLEADTEFDVNGYKYKLISVKEIYK